MNARQKREYAASLLFMCIGSFLELLTLGLLVPFITAIVSPHTAAGFGFVRTLLSSFVPLQRFYPAVLLGSIVLLLFIVKNIVNYYLYASYNSFVYSIASDISRDKIDEYYRLGFPEAQKRNTAEMLYEIAFIPVEFSQHIVLGSMIIISELIMFVFLAAGMAAVQFRVFMLTMFTILPFAALAWRASVRYLKDTRRTIQDRSASNLRTLSDSLFASQEAALYHKEEYFLARYAGGQRDLNIHLGKLNAANAIPGRLSEIFAIAGLMLILLFSFTAEERTAASVITVLTLFAAFAYRIIPVFNKIMNAVVHMHTYAFTADRISPVSTSSAAPEAGKDSNATALRFERIIEMQDITFRYPGQKNPVLQNLSLQIHKSSIIGIAGPSGLGKTSFVRVLLQLAGQSSGKLSIDGEQIDERNLSSWQDLFCYVPQDPVVLSESVKANIAFGIPDAAIDNESVEAILQKVGLYETVQLLPQGVDSFIGERGIRLSGGQKQRLAIARALYRDAEIFIFDEALNALDKNSELGLITLILSLQKSGKTIILISHHDRQLSFCTTVYSLRNGRLYRVEKTELTKEQRWS